MRPSRTARMVACAVTLWVVTASCSMPEPAPPKQAAQPQPISPAKRGEYLAHIAGCHDCHTPGGMYGTPDFGRSMAGSHLGWQGPWGVTYAPNLTPDPETGIGTWNEIEIERALRSGVRKDGSPINPPMPWPSFAHLSPEDMAAIIAYLKSLPPLVHQVPSRLPPGATPSGSVVVMPPPPAWDAPRDPKQP